MRKIASILVVLALFLSVRAKAENYSDDLRALDLFMDDPGAWLCDVIAPATGDAGYNYQIQELRPLIDYYYGEASQYPVEEKEADRMEQGHDTMDEVADAFDGIAAACLAGAPEPGEDAVALLEQVNTLIQRLNDDVPPFYNVIFTGTPLIQFPFQDNGNEGELTLPVRCGSGKPGSPDRAPASALQLRPDRHDVGPDGLDRRSIYEYL